MATIDDTLPDLALARAALDRVAEERRDESVLDRLLADPATRVAEVRGDRIEVAETPGGGLALALRGPREDDPGRLAVHLGRDGSGAAYVAVVADDLDDADDADDASGGARIDRRGTRPVDGPGGWLTLRQAGEALDARDAGVFTTALALANWHAAHPHCPRCGATTRPVQAGWVRRCTNDGSEHYPRTDPAVIMSVVDPDDRLLLGRGAHWPEGRFSVLAGFVEPGESFESAVAREVAEEVGIDIDGARYLGNQPWPFPSSVMVGFAAATRQTDLTPDPTEIAEARWVTRDDYRSLLRGGGMRTPSGISIAKRIIEHWLGQTVESVVGR